MLASAFEVLKMRLRIVLAAVLLAVAGLGRPAHAEDYPWCAYYSTGDGNATNCGFVTREQCMASVSGVGGHCEPNNQYVAPPASRPDAPASPRRADHR